jgi:vacuolar protein sorting-associated protein 13A/C
MTVKYVNAQKTSPEFATKFHSTDQDINILLSTMVFSIAPEPVIAVYDFIMTTFVPNSTPPKHERSIEVEPAEPGKSLASTKLPPPSVIRVAIRLDAIKSE